MKGSVAGDIVTLARLYRTGKLCCREDRLEGVMAAVVFGAQVLPGGRPSGTLLARVQRAAELLLGGEAQLIIPTGGVGEYPPSEAEVMCRLLAERGVSEERIVMETLARSTRESARFAAALARKIGVSSVFVVTDPLHCVRAAAALRSEGIKVRVAPAYSSPMWRSERLRREQFVREAGALLWYAISSQIRR